MAVLASEKLTLEIRFREIDEQQCIQYDCWFRYAGHPILNPAILKRDDGYWQDRDRDGLRASDALDDRLIPTIQEALETNRPAVWRPAENGFSLYIYPEIYFPPTAPEEFSTPYRFDFFPFRDEQTPTRREASGGKLPDDLINLYIPVDLFNFGRTESYGGTGLAMQLCVYRWELENFLDDLKYEYAELLRGHPQRQEDQRAFKDWQIPFEPVVKPVEVYFFQGDMTGWIHINLAVDGTQQTIWASYVFPPFNDLVDFLLDVAEGVVPSQLMVDEEGSYKILRAKPWGDDPCVFRFEMVQPGYPHFHTLIDCLLNRRQFVLSCYNDLVSFIHTHYQPDKWGNEDLVNRARLETLEKLIAAWAG